ncbi:MAG TPA: hypothetical protein DIS75_00380 [Chryseobacterium sp.]|nr:hypothetical protein [Chryseobacterium sp.]
MIFLFLPSPSGKGWGWGRFILSHLGEFTPQNFSKQRCGASFRAVTGTFCRNRKKFLYQKQNE